jgi:ABC-type glycerol-3-phosphate transport system substrate-binding protein
MSSRRIGRIAAAATSAVLVVTACGGVPEASVDPGARPSITVANPASRQVLPEVTVWDVGEKEWVQLANFLPADKPVLVWFWAPH